ncbi:hypothetical protein AgCh_017891 [Apium graveolens]
MPGMKVFSTEEKELIMEPTLKWAGNPNILVAAKAFGLKATVQPHVDFGLKLLRADAMSIPALYALSSCALDQFGNKSIMSAASFSAPVAGSTYVGLKPSPPKLIRMDLKHTTWNPIDNKKFETLSYLPPLTDDSIARKIDYMMKKGWIPCLEFDAVR